MEAPSLPEGNLLSRAARRYHSWHVDKPIWPRGRRFIFRLLVGGVMLVVVGLMLACVAIVFAADIESGVKVQLLKIGASMVFIGVALFAQGHAYRRRGNDAILGEDRRAELASLIVFSEVSIVCGLLLGLWSGTVL